MDSVWETRLAEAERAVIGSPPFEVGERIIAIDAPHYGVATVLKCWLERDHYMLHYEVASGPLKGQGGIAQSDGYVQCPAVWEDAPQPPRLREDEARMLTFGWQNEAMIAEARADDIRSGRLADYIAHLRREAAPWWLAYGALIDPDLARRQAANIRAQADRLEEEAGEQSAAA